MNHDVIENARRYVAKIPPAISGQGGHNQAFKVACILVKGFALSVEQAIPIFDEYSQRCTPPWSPRELEHKLGSANTARDLKPRGYLRDGANSSFPRNVITPKKPISKSNIQHQIIKLSNWEDWEGVDKLLGHNGTLSNRTPYDDNIQKLEKPFPNLPKMKTLFLAIVEELKRRRANGETHVYISRETEAWMESIGNKLSQLRNK